ncbi:MAG: radical SAM protein [Candidatus Azobacteroides sp.]|nr:radical SAM protein [Candidatus Azobacteroides sp.]
MVKKRNILYVHDFIPVTEAEGPGKRACIWVQGCSIRCKGCMVPHTWEQNEGQAVFIDDLFDQLSSNQEIEGLTVLGGEPMDQAEALLPLLVKVKKINLSIIVFTGYYLNQLTAIAQKQIVELCDLLIDGPYVKTLTDFSRPWIGSKNQQIHFLTDRYRYLNDQQPIVNSPVEVRVAADGKIKINGMLPDALLETLQREFERI